MIVKEQQTDTQYICSSAHIFRHAHMEILNGTLLNKSFSLSNLCSGMLVSSPFLTVNVPSTDLYG